MDKSLLFNEQNEMIQSSPSKINYLNIIKPDKDRIRTKNRKESTISRNQKYVDRI